MPDTASPMTDDLVERVARSIAAAQFPDELPFDALSPETQGEYRNAARAAIEVVHQSDAKLIAELREREKALNAECERAWKSYLIAHEQAMANGSALAECRRLLARYRNETPLGHQPHMIAHEVDAALNNEHLQRLRWGADAADRGEGISLAGKSRQERRELLAASGMEARQGGDGETRLHPKDESPVSKAETPITSRLSPNDGEQG